MPEPIQHLNLTQFRLLLPDDRVLSRRIAHVHVHHTWKPDRAAFRGRDTIEAMRAYHMGLGWIDIAQHLTIDPLGGLWTGRNWNLPPASSKGHNGTADVGPFMIEIVGNFDKGQDPFDGEQRKAAFDVVAHVLRVYGLKVDALRFHRELNNNQKTCPGSGIDRKAFDAQVQRILDKKPEKAKTLFAREFLRGIGVTRPVAAAAASEAARDVTVPEHDAAATIVDDRARASVAAAQRRVRYSRDLSALIDPPRSRGEDWSMLRPHVVNMSKGVLSEGGEFSTSPADLDRMLDAVADQVASDPNLRILLYAHGGLVGETDALTYAKRTFDWWLGKGVYPIFFIWESGLLEILRQYIVGPRDVWDWTADPAIEIAAKAPGTLAWSGMKDSARRASAADLGEGVPGGANLFGAKLARFMQRPENAGVTVHTIGHSAGAIFHAHLIPMLRGHGLQNVASLSLLAPACRTELFTQALMPLVANGYIQRHHMFTMEDEAERQDDCFRVYHKSLLYLVSHSFEGLARQPILGLDRSMRKDAALAAFYGLGGGAAAANVEVQFSFARDKEENPLTRSVTHGGFDNDHKTVSSVIRRILGVDDDTGFGESDFPYPPLPRSFDPSDPALAAPPRTAMGTQNRPGASPAAGRRLALCIGIDSYRDRPLAGCVNDARGWGDALSGLGFDVRYLLDQQATYQAIIDGLRILMSGAQAGDVLVMQYSGHGTQLPDDNGDEPFDQAFVPIDYHTGALFLRDDVVAAALTELPAGATLTLFMDCCHSGTNSRFAPTMRAAESERERVRFMPLPPDVIGAHRAYRRGRGRAATAVTSAPGVIHFAACRDQEYAWETDGHGDFTVAATAALAAAVTRGDTNEAFMHNVAREVGARNRQHPEMMLPATGMNGRHVLAALTADAPATTAAAPTVGGVDALLVAQLQTLVDQLKQRVTR